jgi:hypothetical protein
MTNRTDDRADKRLPVTAEVGSEGGSYADPTTQVATFGNEGSGLGTVDHPSNDNHGYALEHGLSDAVAHGTDSTPVMHRYLTDPPPPGPARRPALNWRAATVGAAAGAAGAALALAFRRRRRS